MGQHHGLSRECDEFMRGPQTSQNWVSSKEKIRLPALLCPSIEFKGAIVLPPDFPRASASLH